MKSAYEIAMEKLNKSSGPTRKLNDEQKARIAEIDKKCEARIAEAKVRFEQSLGGMSSAEEYEKARAALGEEIKSLEEKRERDKDAVWDEA